MKLYKSCNTLPIRKFFRIFETDDLRNLVRGFDEENDEFELTKEQVIEFAEIFEDIYYEYSELSENFKLKATLKKQILIREWSFIYSTISHLINMYSEHKVVEVLWSINRFEDPKYTIDLDKPIEPQVRVLIRKMKGLKNKIKIFKLKLSKSMENNKKETKIDLDRDALYLEQNLELKRAIDPDTTSVSSWIKIIQMSKRKSKELSNGKNRHK